MTSPDLPAELKAALDGKLRGFSRSDAAGRAASISKDLPRRRRLRRHPLGSRCAGLRAGADARDLCRGHGQPERAGRDQAGLRADKPARCRRRAGHGHMGGGRSLPIAARISRCWTPTTRCARWRSASSPTAFACVTSAYERGEARAALAKADAADLVVASYMIGEIGDAEQRALAELMWAKTLRHAARGRTRHARRLCTDHRVA